MTTKRLKIVSVRLQGQTVNAYPLGDPSGVWHGDVWLMPAAPDPLVDEILDFTHATRDLLGPSRGPRRLDEILGIIAKRGDPTERARARALGNRLRRRNRRASDR